MMSKPICNRIPGIRMQVDGTMGDYIRGITDQWLLIAPKANPAMLEMFRDRDASPTRHMVPWAGEFAGKYLTGAVQVLRVTGDPKLKAWLKEFIQILISFQDTDGYLGPWPKEYRLKNINSIGVEAWDTWGHYHIMLGMMLWHEDTGDKQALECAIAMADCICKKYLGNKKPRLVDTYPTAVEMNQAVVHSLAILYRKTKSERYLKMALQIVDEFGAKAYDTHRAGVLAGDYLNQALAGTEFFQTPKPRWESLHPIMGMAELYWITGEHHYRQAFEQIWWSNVEFDRHNNGGFSSLEQTQGNPYNFGAIESCCTIAWIAMSVEMLKMTRNSIVADEIELSTLNSVLGMHSSTGRWTTYSTPMNGLRRGHTTDNVAAHFREGSPELSCCSTNSPRGFGMLSDWALMKEREGLVLNYYGPSTMTAKLKRGLSVTLTQETSYPVQGHIVVRVTPSIAADFTLKLRIPHWSQKTSVKLNNKVISNIKPGQYLVINRRWKRNDRIDLNLDMSLHYWIGEKECRGLASVYRGPVLLTYDHRYNLENASKKKQMRDPIHWEPTDCMLSVPELDAHNLKLKPTKWNDWLPPTLLVECKTASGKTVRLCDFASAGEVGTPYLSWLQIKHCPKAKEFSKISPLRTSRPQKQKRR
jgi:uncharacterized protein